MNIFVGNLPPELTEEELKREFLVFGEVISVTIMNDSYTGSGQCRRYGFVDMLSASEGEAAITALNRRVLKLRTIDVIQALPLSHNGGNGSSGHKRAGTYRRNAVPRRSQTVSHDLNA